MTTTPTPTTETFSMFSHLFGSETADRMSAIMDAPEVAGDAEVTFQHLVVHGSCVGHGDEVLAQIRDAEHAFEGVCDRCQGRPSPRMVVVDVDYGRFVR